MLTGFDGKLVPWIVLANLFALGLTLPTNHIYIIRANATIDSHLPSYCAYCVCQNTSDGIITDCSGNGKSNPPQHLDARTIQLNLQRNRISEVKYVYFAGLYNLTMLDLSNNTIIKIEIHAFRDLIKLTRLYLNGQMHRKLFILQKVFKPGVFNGLRCLRILHVHDNLDFREARVSKIPTDALKVLTSLEELRIDGVRNATFNEEFRRLTKLSTIYMSGYNGTCEICYLDSESFVGLKHVTQLTLEKCRIKNISNGTFLWTSKLHYLDLSWNTELEIKQFGQIAVELKYTNITILKINAIHDPNRAGTEILKPDVKYLEDLKLIELHMSDNGIEYIHYGVFQMLPKTLKMLYLRKNRLSFGLYMYEAIFNNPNLDVFDAGDQAVATRSDRAFTSHFKTMFGLSNQTSVTINKVINSLSHTPRVTRSRYADQIDTAKNTIRITPTLSLKTLIFSGSMSDLRPLDFSDTVNNITVIDLSRNFIPMLTSKAFEGLVSVKHLNLSHNYIELVHANVFHGLRALQVMDLGNNLLGHVLEQDRLGEVFAPLVSLKIIDLSRNRINVVNKNVLIHMRYLERINMRDNHIETFDVDLSITQDLHWVDLSYNRIQTISEDVRTHLSKLSKYHTVQVNLSNNKLVCNCDTLPFLKWLFLSQVQFLNIDTYYCSLNNGSVKVFNGSRSDFLKQLDEDCISYQGIILGCSAGSSFILAFVISYLVYHNRWSLRYVYYMAKVKVNQKEVEDDKYEYDVFVSYCDGDAGFVATDMIHNLENMCEKKLIVRDRDFELGEVIALNISKAIRTSKKTFLLLSRRFLRSKWCNFEMNMARMEAIHMKREVIVIIFLETIPPAALPLEIMDLLRDCPNMDLPKEDALRTAFWHKCIDYINN